MMPGLRVGFLIFPNDEILNQSTKQPAHKQAVARARKPVGGDGTSSGIAADKVPVSKTRTRAQNQAGEDKKQIF